MFLLIGLGATIATIVLNITSLVLPYWYYGSYKEYSYHFGLFKVCGTSPYSTACASFTDGGAALNATKGMMILGFLAIVGALVCACLKQFKMRDTRILLQIGAVAAFIACGLMIVGAIIFTTDKSLKHLGIAFYTYIGELSLHAGFALAILAGVAAAAAGVLLIFEFRSGMS